MCVRVDDEPCTEPLQHRRKREDLQMERYGAVNMATAGEHGCELQGGGLMRGTSLLQLPRTSVLLAPAHPNNGQQRSGSTHHINTNRER